MKCCPAYLPFYNSTSTDSLVSTGASVSGAQAAPTAEADWMRIRTSAQQEALKRQDRLPGTSVRSARFNDIFSNPKTRVIPDGNIDANFLYADNAGRSKDAKAFCIATQFPTRTSLRSFMEIAAGAVPSTHVSCIVAIAGRETQNRVDENSVPDTQYFPRYFDKQWLDVHAGDDPGMRLALTETDLGTVGAFDELRLTISLAASDVTREIPVIYISQWPDFGVFEELPRVVERIRTLGEGGHPDAIPMIHCRAGVGRTGVLAATLRLSQPDNRSSVSEVVMSMRRDRCAGMVQTEAQYASIYNAFPANMTSDLSTSDSACCGCAIL